MKTTIEHGGKPYQIDLSEPLDISIPLRGNDQNVGAWGLEHPKIIPHTDGNFTGKVSEGAAINFNNIRFNPHAHGTHTECVGHITEEFHSVNQSLTRFFFPAGLISVTPELQGDDWVISKHIVQVAIESSPDIATFLNGQEIEILSNRNENKSSGTSVATRSNTEIPTAMVIRTRPNDRKKLSRQYSGMNPPYLLKEAALFLVELGVEHLLIDLPSVDKENDNGELLAHKAFWNFDGLLRQQATITELIYVPDGIKDGRYFLNLQVASFENDASPSRPVLYRTKL